jgi:transcriptional regulator with XRE-family HTH domain
VSQNDLAKRAGISQATISAVENDRVRLGVERAKALQSGQAPRKIDPSQ